MTGGASVAAAPGGGGHLGIVVDLTDDAALAAAVDRAAGEAGRIDVLVNNAGFARLAPAEDVAVADWDAHMAQPARAVSRLPAGRPGEAAAGRRLLALEWGPAASRSTRSVPPPSRLSSAAVLSRASGAAGMVNGGNPVIDGGFTIQ